MQGVFSKRGEGSLHAPPIYRFCLAALLISFSLALLFMLAQEVPSFSKYIHLFLTLAFLGLAAFLHHAMARFVDWRDDKMFRALLAAMPQQGCLSDRHLRPLAARCKQVTDLSVILAPFSANPTYDLQLMLKEAARSGRAKRSIGQGWLSVTRLKKDRYLWLYEKGPEPADAVADRAVAGEMPKPQPSL